MGKRQFQRKSDQEFYEAKSWGSVAIAESKDLPTLKLKRLMEVLGQRKKRDATVLEVGCGAGRILASIRARDKHLKLTGVDISAHEIALAKRDNKGKRIAFVRANGERMPFRTGTFDYVVFLDYIEHVDNPDAALKEIARVLKAGGILHGVSPAERHGVYGLSTKVLGWHIKEKTAGHIQQYTIAGLLAKVKKAGLDITDVSYSYHLLGSMMDYAMFTLLLNKRVAKLFWGQNKYYKDEKTKQSLTSRIMNGTLSIANAIAYGESTLLKSARWTATAVHLTARKGGT